MKTFLRKALLLSLAALLLTALVGSWAWAEDYEALKGVDAVKVMFDVRDASAPSAALHLSLIYDTYQDLVAMKKNPACVVVFMGGAVKMISSDMAGFSAEDQKALAEIAATIAKMDQAGIKLEVCLFAVKVVGVDPATILPQIKGVGNGWISEIGYQAQGYSLVPVY